MHTLKPDLGALLLLCCQQPLINVNKASPADSKRNNNEKKAQFNERESEKEKSSAAFVMKLKMSMN